MPSLDFLKEAVLRSRREDRGRVQRLYQWLSHRASFFRSDSSSGGRARSVRTDVMLERQETILVVSGAAADLNCCPFCGQRLAGTQAEEARSRLQRNSMTHDNKLKRER